MARPEGLAVAPLEIHHRCGLRWRGGDCGRHRRSRGETARASRDGSAVLAMVLPDLDGREQPLAQWRGKVLVVNFWATWCAPCREEMPQFIAAQQRDGAKGVQFVGIAVDQADKVREFRQGDRLELSGADRRFRRDRDCRRRSATTCPRCRSPIVLDRAGKVAHTQLGPAEGAPSSTICCELLTRAAPPDRLPRRREATSAAVG